MEILLKKGLDQWVNQIDKSDCLMDNHATSPIFILMSTKIGEGWE